MQLATCNFRSVGVYYNQKLTLTKRGKSAIIASVRREIALRLFAFYRVKLDFIALNC